MAKFSLLQLGSKGYGEGMDSDDAAIAPSSTGPGDTFKDRLNYLFETQRDANGAPFTNRAVLAAINESGREARFSAGYLSELRRGIKDNPTIKHVEALAGVFGVDPSYFLTERDRAAAQLAEAMESAGVRDLALRAKDMSPETLSAVAGVLERLGELERREAGDSEQ